MQFIQITLCDFDDGGNDGDNDEDGFKSALSDRVSRCTWSLFVRLPIFQSAKLQDDAKVVKVFIENSNKIHIYSSMAWINFHDNKYLLKIKLLWRLYIQI